jgi:hypothetical protein
MIKVPARLKETLTRILLMLLILNMEPSVHSIELKKSKKRKPLKRLRKVFNDKRL